MKILTIEIISCILCLWVLWYSWVCYKSRHADYSKTCCRSLKQVKEHWDSALLRRPDDVVEIDKYFTKLIYKLKF